MSAFNYTKAAQTARTLLVKFGQELIITRNVPGTYDPATGQLPAGTNTTGVLKAVVLSIGRQSVEGLDDRYIQDLITGKVRKVIAAALGSQFRPQAGDLLTYESQTWTLLSAIPLNPGGVDVIYTMGIQKAGKIPSSSSGSTWNTISDTWNSISQPWSAFT